MMHRGPGRSRSACRAVQRWVLLCAFGASLVPLVAVHAASADGAPAEAAPWKLTVGQYEYSNYLGSDVNLRYRRSASSAWVGVYQDQNFGTQARAGADTSISLVPGIALQPSMQLASRGFVGGSVNLQVGGEWYGLVGIGRTNLRPYFNLNFDPNDALTVGAGHGSDGGVEWLVFLVADDRLHTGQRDYHFNLKLPHGNSHATIDIMRKSGLSDGGSVTAWGGSFNWDWPRLFLRVAYDPYQNFSTQSVWRFAGGVRF